MADTGVYIVKICDKVRWKGSGVLRARKVVERSARKGGVLERKGGVLEKERRCFRAGRAAVFVERTARKGGVLKNERRCFKSRTGDVLEQGGQRCLWRDPQGKAVF